MQKSEDYLTQDIYSEHLNTINKINFTRREIDIIACLLSARGTSKIASVLSVSPRTVTTHIHNIMLKLECNSRESIIDFIEKSGKISILRKYYLGLLIKRTFEKKLHEISKLKPDSTPFSFVAYWHDQQLRTSFLHHLVNHLGLAGVMAKIQEQELSKEIIKSEDSSQVLFLLIKKEPEQEIPRKHLTHTFIDTSKNESYYDCVFEILTKFYSNKNVNEIFTQFNEWKKSIQFSSTGEFKEVLNDQKTKYNKKMYLYIFSGVFLIFSTSFFFLYHKKLYIISPAETSPHLGLNGQEKKVTSYVPTLLTKYEKFIGREENINAIDNLLANNNVVVITGRSGVGKSCLAAEYARKQDRIVRYIDSDSGEKIAHKYRELGQEFGIDLTNQPSYLVMKLVNNYLNIIPHHFLFILDNVDNYDIIKDYISNAPKNVKVLITTTNPNLILNTPQIVLEKFQVNEAKEYLSTCLYNRKIKEEEKIAIIQKASTLPYDLKCVVAYLLENFTTSLQDLIENIGNQLDLKLFEQLAKDENKIIAWQILQYAAYLDPDFIDIKIFKNLFCQNSSHITDAIKSLESLSLLSIIYDSNNQAGVRIHRELQKEIKKSASHHSKYAISESQIVNNLLMVLENLFPVVNHKPGSSWQEADKLVRHIKKILIQNNKNYIKNNQMEAKIYYKLGAYYSSVNIDRPQALKYAEYALEKRKTLRPLNYFDISDSLESIGNIYVCNNVNDIQKGIKYLKDSLTIRKKLHPGNHPVVATTLRNLGIAYLTAEEKEKELQFMQASLKMRQILYKDNHYEVAESLNDLAWSYYELGNYKNAMHYIKQSVHMFEILYPKGEPSTVYALHTLAVLMIEEGNIQRSLEILHRALDIAIAYRMDNHFTTAFILYDLGRAYLRNNDCKNALVYSLKGFAIRESLNKANGKRNLLDQSFHVLGDIYRLGGRKKDAMSMYEKALEVQKQFSLLNKPESQEIKKKIRMLKNNLNNNYDIFSYLQEMMAKVFYVQ